MPGARSPLTLIGTDHLLTGILLARQGLGHALLERRAITRKALREAMATETRLPRSSGGKDAEHTLDTIEKVVDYIMERKQDRGGEGVAGAA